jgi:drug/metabolite transporter (DMT)-like permease
MSAPAPRTLALAWLILCCLAWTGVTVTVRMIEGRVHPNDLSFLRACLSVLFMLPLLLARGATEAFRIPRGRPLAYFAARATMLFFAQAAYYYAVTNLAIADAVVLNQTTPIFVALLAPFVLGERVDRWRWLAIGLGIAGILAILRPGFSAVGWGALIGLTAAILFAGTAITNKLLTRTEPASRVVFGTNALVAVIGLGPFLASGAWPAGNDMILVALFCLFGAAAQYGMARAMELADATFLGPFDFVRVPMAALAGWLFFAQVPAAWTWIGTAVIFLGVVALTRQVRPA